MESGALLGGGEDTGRKILGHPVKDWITLAALTAITILLIVILSVVLPTYGGVHPCTPKAESLVGRMSKEEGSKVYERLQYIAQTFGPRKDGHEGLARAIDWIVEEMKRDNLTATKEAVNVPKWSRGAESASLFLPTGIVSALRIFGLVGSVGAKNLTAPIVVVASFAELTAKAAEAKNKVVVFDHPWDNGTSSFDIVHRGAVEAAKVGAVACLIRSATPFSLDTMHVGVVNYESGVTRIPAASITVEDANYLNSLYAAGRQVSVKLDMDAQTDTNATSHNIIVDLEGASEEKKEEFVVIGAHLDTLDLGQGVQDSLAGFVMAWEGLRIMKLYKMTPARSIRLVGWTGSELGHLGALEYASSHSLDTAFAFDANKGTSSITGIYLTTFGEEGSTLMKGIANIFTILGNAGNVVEVDSQPTSEINALIYKGVPGATFKTVEENDKFYWYSDSEADRLDTVTAAQLRSEGGIMAAYAYCVADASEDVPKRGD